MFAEVTVHALVVGGSGMLAEVPLELCRRGFITSVVARRASRLAALARRVSGPGRIHSLTVDYHSSAELVSALRSAERELGRYALAVVWVHSTAPAAVECIAGVVAGAAAGAVRPVPFYHVLSSATVHPLQLSEGWSHMRSWQGIGYRQVLLGCRHEGTNTRWLSHREISAGVLRALESDQDPHIVGDLPPYRQRGRRTRLSGRAND